MRYKVGDRVILGEHPGRKNWSDTMDQWVGKEAVLVKRSAYYPDQWRVDIDKGGWSWQENSFDQCPCKINSCLRHKRKARQ
jgi:hypothetical protein